jgi:flagellar hook-associated protein 1
VKAPPPVTPNPAHPTTDLNLQATVQIKFDNPPTTYSVTGPGTGNPVGVPYVAGQDITFNGWTVQISGTPAVNDTFTVGPNTNATGDNRNALLMAGLQTKNILANGTASFQGAYGQLVGQIGAKTNELSVTSTAQTSMLNETIKQQQSISGVNLDEEAANLLRYQRAYEASAQAMKIANTMFDALLALG